MLKYKKFASVSLSASSTEPSEGENVTVTANVTAGAWNLQLVGANKKETVFGFTQSASNESNSKSITFTAGSAGTTYNFTLTGDMTDINSDKSEPVNKSITITVKAKEIEKPDNGGETTPPPATVKSAEAKLIFFGITPLEYDFSGFSRNPNKENWSTEVPNNVTEINVKATPAGKNAKVSGTGKVSLKEGINEIKVTVTAEAGNTKTYTLTVTRKPVEEDAMAPTKVSSNADLKTLGIKPTEYDFDGFKKDVTEYSIEVPEYVKEIEVCAEPANPNAQVNGAGIITLEEGKNDIKIEVIAEDGTKKIYTIEVTRGEGTEEDDSKNKKFGLSKLTIAGLSLSPSFMVGTYDYTVELTEDLTSLEIEAKSNDKDATVEIIGNENLQPGENTITILVQNKETKENATYQITVNKNVKENVVQKSWLKPSTWGKEEIIKIAIIIVLIILIISAIVLKVKMTKEKKSNNEIDLPGAEELDKAIIEHQELSEEEYEEYNEMETENVENNWNEEQNIEEEIPRDEVSQNYIEDIAKYKFGDEQDFEVKPRRRGKHF